MSNLFNEFELQKRVMNYHRISPENMQKYQEIFRRWHEKIDKSNEDAVKPQFFQEIFADILNYNNKHGTKNINLITETRDPMNKVPDGILGYDFIYDHKLIRAVIEIKRCNVDLDKVKDSPIEQAFKYATATNGQCEFVIVSNFVEIRLYDARMREKYHQFFLSDLANDEYKIKEFYYLLAFERLFSREKDRSPVHDLRYNGIQSTIEREFYHDYKNLRSFVKDELIKANHDNPRFKPNFYLYKSQKLIDRFIFMRFARDNGALEINIADEIRNHRFISKYETCLQIFNGLNQGIPQIGLAKFTELFLK